MPEVGMLRVVQQPVVGEREPDQHAGWLPRAAAQLWATIVDTDGRSQHDRELLARVDSRLGLAWAAERDAWVLSYAELEARGLAEQLAECAPPGLSVSVGRPARSWESTLAYVLEQTGVDVRAAKVRAGFTRGHLLEVVVALPVAPEAELAAELAVEGLLGESFVDDWVLAVGAQPLLRGGPLRVVQNGPSDADMHPLRELVTIAERAVSAIDGLLPTEPRASARFGAEWTLLEMEPSGDGPQAERVLVTTCLPELVKCALEGMPFHSRRFSKLGERFAWLSTPVRGERGGRQGRREQIEAILDAVLRERGLGAVIGTGFGEREDFFDLCLAPSALVRSFDDAGSDPALRTLCEVLRSLELGGAGAVLGFYDTRFADARIRP